MKLHDSYSIYVYVGSGTVSSCTLGELKEFILKNHFDDFDNVSDDIENLDYKETIKRQIEFIDTLQKSINELQRAVGAYEEGTVTVAPKGFVFITSERCKELEAIEKRFKDLKENVERYFGPINSLFKEINYDL